MGNKKKQSSTLSAVDEKENLNESDEFITETLDKQNYKIWLRYADIVNIARFEYKWHGSDGNVIFEVIESKDQLQPNLTRHMKTLKKLGKQSMTFIINLNNNHWVTLIVIYQYQKLFAYYVDSLGEKLPDIVHKKLKSANPGIEIIDVPNEQQCDNVNNCGILALEYARIFNEGLEANSRIPIITNDLLCYQPIEEDLKDMRINFAEKLRNFANLNITNMPTSRDSQLEQPSTSSESEVQQFEDHSEPGSAKLATQDSQDSQQSNFDNHTEDKINEIKLLIAEGSRDLEKADLLEEVDVNFVSKADGNTLLHHAVQSRRLCFVQQLINKGANVFIENNENRTPLDIAIETKKKEIIDELVQKIVCTSLKILKADTPNNNEVDLLNNDDIKAKLLRDEIKRKIEQTEEKIQYCWELLQDLNSKPKNTHSETLSYEQANALIYFTEAFALVGFSAVIQKEMKKHFSKFYTGNDRKLIAEVHQFLVDEPKKGHRKLSLEDVSKFIRVDEIDDFFNSLQKYVEHVKNKRGFATNKIKLIDILNNCRSIGASVGDPQFFLCEELKKLIPISYVPEHIAVNKVTPKLLFNFMVNFYPAYMKETGNNFRELGDLRNNVVHAFNEYPLSAFSKHLFRLRDKLFKYYAAEQMHRVLYDKIDVKDCKTITDQLNEKLDKLNKLFEHNEEQHISEDEIPCSIGCRSGKEIYKEKDENCDVQKLVDQYLKFMIVIDGDKKNDQNAQSRKVLCALKRREIFENFSKLKNIRQSNNKNDYCQAKEMLKKELVEKYGIKDGHFDEICHLYVEANNELDQKISNASLKSQVIAYAIKALRQFKNIDKANLYNEDIISLCDHILVNKKDIFGSGKNKRLLPNLPYKARKNIRDRLHYLPDDFIIKISVGNDVFSICSSIVISNILKIFFNTYYTHEIEFNIKEIFNDETFLDLLIEKEMKNTNTKMSLRDNKLHNRDMIIRNLLKEDYAAPYIVRLMPQLKKKQKNKKDLEMLIEILLKERESLYIKHLDKLLKIRIDNYSLYEIVCNKICDLKLNFESLHLVFRKSRNVKGISDVFFGRMLNRASIDDTLKSTQEFFESVNDVVQEIIFQTDYQQALDILNSESDAISRYDNKIAKHEHKNNMLPVVVEYKLKRIGMELRLTEKKHGKNGIPNEEEKDVYNSILNTLEKIECNDNRQILSVLYYKAYTQTLLGKYHDSYKGYENLCKKIAEYVLGCSGTRIEPYSERFYTNIEKSTKYKDLLLGGYKKYLDISNIRENMAYNKIKLGIPNTFGVALKINQEVYAYRKKTLGIKHKDTVQSLRRISFTYYEFSQSIFKNKNNYQGALQNSVNSLLHNCKVYYIQKEMYGAHHPTVIKVREYIVNNLRNIAFASNGLGDLRSLTRVQKSAYYNNALNIYRQVYEFQKCNLGKTHEYTANIADDIASTKKRLAQF